MKLSLDAAFIYMETSGESLVAHTFEVADELRQALKEN